MINGILLFGALILFITIFYLFIEEIIDQNKDD